MTCINVAVVRGPLFISLKYQKIVGRKKEGKRKSEECKVIFLRENFLKSFLLQNFVKNSEYLINLDIVCRVVFFRTVPSSESLWFESKLK